MLTQKELPACPVATLVEIIGNKWKLLIIRNLLTTNPINNKLQKYYNLTIILRIVYIN